MAGERILVVEDEAHIQDLLRFYLEGEGFAVELIATGADAVARLDRDAADFVILDIMLPQYSGVEVLRELRARDAWDSVPVLMLTAKTAEQDVVTAFDAGADDYVVKPFQLESLVARIKRLMRSRQSTGR